MRNISGILILMILGLGGADAAEVPYGSKDFYPSPERPVGFRGDGNGFFPGATPVTEWWEGTPAELEREFPDQWGNLKKGKYWDLSDSKSKNIVWKTRLPAWGNTQPIVVGDRVFTTAEPDMLVCLDARSGKVLWSVRNNVWAISGVEKELADRLSEMWDISREAVPQFWAMAGRSTMSRVLPADELEPIARTFTQQCMPRIVEALKKLDPETNWDDIAKRQSAALDEYIATLRKDGEVGKHGKSRDFEVLKKTIHQRIVQLSGLKMPKLDQPWYHLVGYAMSVPVSDGKHVYASFGQGQMVCYDLDGKLVWAKYFEQEHDGSRMSHAQSPLLAGDVLVDMHGGTKTLRGLDKKTGQQIWEAPTRGDHSFGKGGGYYVGSHKMVWLSDGAKREPYIVTTLCNVIRARDGQVMGPLPFDFGPSGGPPITSGGPDGDIVIKAATGDNYATPIIAYRLKIANEKLVAEVLWRSSGERDAPGYHGHVMTDKLLCMTSAYGNIIDVATGKVLSKSRDRGAYRGLSHLLVGKYWLWADEGSGGRNSSWGRRRFDQKALGVFHLRDISNPASPAPVSDGNVLGGAEDVSVPAMEKYAPELYARKDYYGNSYGKPAHFMHTDNAVFASGNRLFVRTAGWMYCIGDPAVEYDWNPASRR